MSFIQALIGSVTNAGGGAPLDITTVGGTRNVVGAYSYHTWASNDTYTLNTAADRDIEWCIIGGGGSGGKCQGGVSQPGPGAGAGEQIYGTYVNQPAGTWNCIIGAGGAGVPGTGNPTPWWPGNQGNQTYSSQTSGSGGDQCRANGGGRGNVYEAFGLWYTGAPGGCGGGGSGGYGAATGGGSASPYSPNPAWTTSRSTAGGNGSYNSSAHTASGGGGGIGGAGGHASNVSPWNFYASPISSGPAGIGAYHALTNGSTTTASTTGVGGAGATGGGVGNTAPGGVAASTTGATVDAPANSGSGSSCAQENYYTGAGGSGYVIIRWVTLV